MATFSSIADLIRYIRSGNHLSSEQDVTAAILAIAEECERKLYAHDNRLAKVEFELK